MQLEKAVHRSAGGVLPTGIGVRILGPLSVTLGGEDVTPSAPKLRQVIGLLAAAPGAAVRTERVTEELWPDDGGAQHSRSIQTYVWQIRRLLTATEPDASVAPIRHATRVGYCFDLSAVAVDVAELGVRRQRAEELLVCGSPEEAVDEFVRGVELCRGPALHDVPLGPVLVRGRRHLESNRLAMLVRCLQTLEQLDRPDQVLSYFERVIQESVTHEGLYAPMVTALHRIGQRSAAVELYHWARRGCVDETGLEPGPLLREAADRALSDEPVSSRTAPPAPPERVAASAATGRAWTTVHDRLEPAAAELVDPASVERVVAALATDPGAGGRRVVRVTGPPRSGRSSLCRVVSARLARTFPDGVLHLDLDANTPSGALTTVLRAVTGDGEALPSGLAGRAEMWRRATAGRRVLVVVEGVVDLVHVPLFLPGSHQGAVLVESRTAAASEVVTHTVALPAPALAAAGPRDDAMIDSVLLSLGRVDARARASLLAAARRPPSGRRLFALPTAVRLGLSRAEAELGLDDLVHVGFARRRTDPQELVWYDLVPAYASVLAEISRRETPPATMT